MTAEVRRTGSGLGRGLAALIPQRDDSRGSVELPISSIARNPYQPRDGVERAAIEQLAASIAEHGVLQPILVTQTAQGYVLIAGERRVRAAEMAGLERIPALVRAVGEQEKLAFALVENLQRADLSPLEEARAFQRLAHDFGLTQEEVAQRVGRSRSAVANTLRLLDAAPAIQAALAGGAISEGHARALGGLTNLAVQEEVLKVVLARSLSVRETEDLVRRQNERRTVRGTRTETSNPELDRLETGLRQVLATKVRVTPGRRGGRITIEYYSDEDLGRLYERLTGESVA
ncbi:MAG TPA: ParB/RepB/Spo0J family partition protein [Candidatus Caenarcaniphilales bacterium]|nr:ParB/RepB/Spo0J family partition protein [Candidatus Caenarcaniphilales bacterium]